MMVEDSAPQMCVQCSVGVCSWPVYPWQYNVGFWDYSFYEDQDKGQVGGCGFEDWYE